MRLRPRLRQNVAVNLGFITRSRLVHNCINEIVEGIGRTLGGSHLIRGEIVNCLNDLEQRIEKKLVSEVKILFYSNEQIVSRLTLRVDWSESDYLTATQSSPFFDDEDTVVSSVQEFADTHLPKLLHKLNRAVGLDDVRFLYTISDFAIEKYGLNRARQLANLVPLNAEDQRHVDSFKKSTSGRVFTDRSLSEFSVGVEVGQSSRRNWRKS